MPLSSGPHPEPMPGIIPAFPPSSATRRDPGSVIVPHPHSPEDEMLERIALYVDPPPHEVKAGNFPPVGSYANVVAKLCLYSYIIDIPKKRDILFFVDSDDSELHSVVSCTLSTPIQIPVAERSKIRGQFNGLVKQVLTDFASWCRSWNATPRRDIPPEEAAKQLMREAYLAPNRSGMPWSFLVVVFGRIPEFWGLEPWSSFHYPGPQAPSPSVGGKGKMAEIPRPAPPAQLEGSPAAGGVDPMAIDPGVLGSLPYLPYPEDFDPRRGIRLPDLGFVDIHNTTSAPIRRANPVSGVQTTDTAQSTLPDGAISLLQQQDLTTFLSAFGIIHLLPGSELSTMLHASLESHETFKAADLEELNQAMAEVLNLLHEFKQVHGDFLKEMWRSIRRARQWHTWGQEVQHFNRSYGVSLPAKALSAQRRLFTFLNGFTILVLQLMEQQAGFEPPQA